MPDSPKLLIPQFGRLYDPFRPVTEPLIRLIAGGALAWHGQQILFGGLEGAANFFESVGFEDGLLWAWIVGILEFVCGLCLALGLFTRLAAFVASGEMAVAYVQFHWLKSGVFLPTAREQGGNGGELALLYAFVFLFIACKGSGIWSLSAARRRSVG